MRARIGALVADHADGAAADHHTDELGNGILRAGTGLITFANFFHRDDQRVPYANRFTPELWLSEQARDHWPLIPFSAGPAVCPGKNLVLLVSSAMLSALLAQREVWLQAPTWLTADRPLPGTLSPYGLRFKLDG